MQYAVEARIFNNGKIVVKARPATPDDVEGCMENRICDVWVDLFDNETEARRFAREYKNA